MVDEDYEIISHKEVARLKQELKALKEGELTASNKEISHKLNQMIDIFKEASIMMKDEKSSKDSHNEIMDKLDKLLDQNQKIAEGVLAVADMISKPIPVKAAPKPLTPGPQPMRPEPMHPEPLNIPGQPMPPNPMGSEPIHPEPLNAPIPPRPIKKGIPPAPTPESFPSPGMPSLNPMEEPGKPSVGGHDIPPLPPRPKKKGLFH
tara:strand:- start:1662 stop:2276 length:615 start_codon:yes stop_codon:yes gene_type:complete